MSPPIRLTLRLIVRAVATLSAISTSVFANSASQAFQYINERSGARITLNDGYVFVAYAGETTSALYGDCSDTDFRCIELFESVLAIPKNGLRSGQIYNKLGVKFEVIDCQRGNSNVCASAIIASFCNSVSKNCPIEQLNRTKRTVMYFHYQVGTGISSFGYSEQLRKRAHIRDARAHVNDYALRKGTAILADE